MLIYFIFPLIGVIYIYQKSKQNGRNAQILKEIYYFPEELSRLEANAKALNTDKEFQAIKRIVFCSLFAIAPHRKDESLKKLSDMELFDRNIIERGVFPFLK